MPIQYEYIAAQPMLPATDVYTMASPCALFVCSMEVGHPLVTMPKSAQSKQVHLSASQANIPRDWLAYENRD